MANIIEPTEEQIKGYQDWLASRPDNVRKVAERFEPWALYRMKSTGHRVTVRSFGVTHNNTVELTVRVSGEYNSVAFARDVFGIDPNDLEPCELPLPGEPVGEALTQAEVKDNIGIIRSVMGAHKKN